MHKTVVTVLECKCNVMQQQTVADYLISFCCWCRPPITELSVHGNSSKYQQSLTSLRLKFSVRVSEFDSLVCHPDSLHHFRDTTVCDRKLE